MNSIQKIEIIEDSNARVVDSRLVAEGLNIEHESLVRAIARYKAELEDFGHLRELVGKTSFIRKDGSKGAAQFKYYWLNEEQFYLIAALSKNSEEVIKFKLQLIKAFQQVRQELKAVTSQVKEFKDKTLDQLSEDEIRDALILLDSRNFSRWKWEASYTDPLREPLPGGERTRRYDAIAKFGRVIRILELKARPITSVEVAEILDERGYLEIAAAHNPGKCLDIVLCGTSLADSGKRSLERLGAEHQYQSFTVSGYTYRAKIRFMSIQEFATSITTRALNEMPQTSKWVYVKEILKYAPIFPERCIYACKKLYSSNSSAIKSA
jgi:phage regulator Rha-like protein